MTQSVSTKPLLPLGRVVATIQAQALLDLEDVNAALWRHENLDWGEVSERDWQSNNEAIKKGFRVISSYRDSEGTKFWIITEADRSATTVMLPEEY